MNIALSGGAAFLLAAAAWCAEQSLRAYEQALLQAEDLRYAVLDNPRRAVPEHCRERRASTNAQVACGVHLEWRGAAHEFVDICTDGAPPAEDDQRLNPRRFYRLIVDCPAILPKLGRQVISTTFKR